MTDFSDIYSRYFREVYHFAFSLCRSETIAEEITQETFFKALSSLDTFDGKCKVSVWLCQIAKNAFLSQCRKEKHIDRNADISLLVSNHDIENLYLTKESAFEVHKALHALPEPYKEVFSLRTFGELSYEQIAELFGKTPTWARVTYHRARLKIKEELK